MKAQRIVFAARETVRIEEGPPPGPPGPGEVLVETACTMVSPGTELAALKGTHSRSGLPDAPAWLRYPSVPGYLACGTVAQAGAGVEGFRPGDRVVAEGPGVWNSHASHLLMDAADYRLQPIPEGVPFERAVTAKLGSIAMTAIRVLRPQLGETVAVLGLGVVGQIAARLALLAGAREVVGVEPIAARRRLAEQRPGIRTLAPEDGLLEAVKVEGTELAGFDCVIEASGSPQAFLLACRIARLRGRVAVLSSPHRSFEIRLYDQIHSRGLQILGAHGQVLARTPGPADTWTDGRQRGLFMQLLAEGRIQVDPLFTHRVPFTEAPEIYRGLSREPGRYLGVLFYWNGRRPPGGAAAG